MRHRSVLICIGVAVLLAATIYYISTSRQRTDMEISVHPNAISLVHPDDPEAVVHVVVKFAEVSKHPITLDVLNLPPNFVATFGPQVITSDGAINSTLTIRVTDIPTVRTHTLIIMAKGDNIDAYGTIYLVIRCTIV